MGHAVGGDQRRAFAVLLANGGRTGGLAGRLHALALTAHLPDETLSQIGAITHLAIADHTVSTGV